MLPESIISNKAPSEFNWGHQTRRIGRALQALQRGRLSEKHVEALNIFLALSRPSYGDPEQLPSRNIAILETILADRTKLDAISLPGRFDELFKKGDAPEELEDSVTSQTWAKVFRHLELRRQLGTRR